MCVRQPDSANLAASQHECYNITYRRSISLCAPWHRWLPQLFYYWMGMVGHRWATKRSQGASPMATCTEKHHANHTHSHGPKCGHTAVRHDGHVDYLHDGHLHHVHEDHVDEHVVAVDATNPVNCTPQVHCSHAHGPNCGHEEVPHGDHVDYLVDGRLHHPHGDHCDDHGPVQLA